MKLNISTNQPIYKPETAAKISDKSYIKENWPKAIWKHFFAVRLKKEDASSNLSAMLADI